MEDSNIGQNEAILRHFRLKCLRMPSFCPILESSIIVMHRRISKNDPKFTKICFCRELSLKSGKIIFYEFWMIFGHSTVHHLKKTPKNTWKLHLQKKPHFLVFLKNTGFFAFLVPYLWEKFIKIKKNFFWIFFKHQRPKVFKIIVIALFTAQSSQIPQKKPRFLVFLNHVRNLADGFL